MLEVETMTDFGTISIQKVWTLTLTLVGILKVEKVKMYHYNKKRFQKKAKMQSMKNTKELKKKANTLDQDQVGNKFLKREPPVRPLLTVLMNNTILGARQLGTGGVRDHHDHNSTRMVAPRTGAATDHGATITHRAASTFREIISMAEQMILGAGSSPEISPHLGTARNPRSTSGATSSRLKLGW